MGHDSSKSAPVVTDLGDQTRDAPDAALGLVRHAVPYGPAAQHSSTHTLTQSRPQSIGPQS
jgi:hypothetical protein